MTTRAQLRRLLDKWTGQLSAPQFFCVVHPAEMPQERALEVARAHGLPEGTIYTHPAFSVSQVSWKALL